jgi:hypothetical protein
MIFDVVARPQRPIRRENFEISASENAENSESERSPKRVEVTDVLKTEKRFDFGYVVTASRREKRGGGHLRRSRFDQSKLHSLLSSVPHTPHSNTSSLIKFFEPQLPHLRKRKAVANLPG